jgi:sugar/nucleoside kinase (ribokinase family)
MAVPRLVVAGKLVVDEVLRLAHPVTPGSQQRALEHGVSGGGQVWHTALAAARARTSVTVTGWRGADDVSAGLAGALAAAGVLDRLVSAGTPTRALVLVGPDGDRAIVSVAPTGRITPADLDVPTLLDGVRWLHLDGYALDPTAGDALVALAQVATRAGVPVSMEPPSLPGLRLREPWLAALPPLALLVGRPAEVISTSRALSAEPAAVAVHDGANPVLLRRRYAETRLDVPPYPVETNGAGDRLTGGLLAALVGGADDRSALAAGIRAAQQR